MFKRLSDTLRSMMISESDCQIKALLALGFDENRSRQALEATNGNVSSAAEILFQEQDHASKTPTMHNTNNSETNPTVAQPVPRTRAGKAALERAQQQGRVKQQRQRVELSSTTQPISASRPTQPQRPIKAIEIHHELSLPTPMSALTKEDQILRCAQRLAPHSLTVDSLIKLLKNIRQYPQKDTYRTIYKSNPEYQRVIQDKPGAQDLLHAVHFYSTTHNGTDVLVLARSMVDPALLFLALSALEKIREESQEYKTCKAMLSFDREIQSLLTFANCSEQEAIQRADFLAKCPTESFDSGVLLQVHLGPNHTLSRRFDGDDTLRDVLHWLGAHSSVLPNKLLSREWLLVNLNSFPVQPMDAVQDTDRTLLYLGCFPSARLEIRPSSLSNIQIKIH